MPVFFLYFSARVSLGEVLQLEAIYYAGVVLVEVPSGYVSDRFGRRPTLVVASLALVAAYAVFALATSFAQLAVAQALLALGLAFNSGTDTSFHLANLERVGRAELYAGREARLGTLSFVIGAVAALAGGAAALIDMRLAYLLSLAAALVALVSALSFRPIPGPERASGARLSLFVTLRRCFATVRDRDLAWFFGAAVVATVINHVPYEFYQPYLRRLDFIPFGGSATPLVAGVHLAIVQLIAAPVAGVSTLLSQRLGVVTQVVLSMMLQLALIVSMACFVSPLVAVLLVARSVPRALQDAPLRAAVAPRVASELRATYLSLESLVGRLGFASLLWLLSLFGHELTTVLWLSASVSIALVLLLSLFAPRRRRPHARP